MFVNLQMVLPGCCTPAPSLSFISSYPSAAGVLKDEEVFGLPGSIGGSQAVFLDVGQGLQLRTWL